MTRRALVALLLSSAMSAQSHVVPSVDEEVTTASPRWLAGLTGALVHQVLIDESLLGPLVGKQITGLRVRRGLDYPLDLDGGVGMVTLSLSESPNPASRPSSVLEQNQLSPVQVYSGSVNLPQSPRVEGDVYAWIPQNSVELTFDTPFDYGGGTLALTFRGALGFTYTTDTWPVEYVRYRHGGDVEAFGNYCGDLVAEDSVTGRANLRGIPSSLIPGGTAEFLVRAASGNSVFMLLGRELSTPADLGLLGFPGCLLYVDSSISVASAVAGELLVPEAPNYGAYVAFGFDLPVSPSILGATFAGQAAELGEELWSSNALRMTISSDLPSLGMSLVTVEYENGVEMPSGRVEIDTGPVLRFEYR